MVCSCPLLCMTLGMLLNIFVSRFEVGTEMHVSLWCEIHSFLNDHLSRDLRSILQRESNAIAVVRAGEVRLRSQC